LAVVFRDVVNEDRDSSEQITESKKHDVPGG